jgi:hypothetical protein
VKLQWTGDAFLNFREGGIIGPWIEAQFFAFDSDADDESILDALIEHWTYDHSYAEPRKKGPSRATRLHGPYLRNTITADIFDLITSKDARSLIQRWAAQGGALPPEFQLKLAQLVDSTLIDGEPTYALPDIRDAAEHEWGWIVGGHTGFLEYVTISHKNKTVSLLVASDD